MNCKMKTKMAFHSWNSETLRITVCKEDLRRIRKKYDCLLLRNTTIHARLSTHLVGWIFPHWNDTLAKDMVVGVDGQVTGWLQIVENSPKALDRIESAALGQIVLPFFVRVLVFWIVVPQRPFGIEVMGLVEQGVSVGDFTSGGHDG